MYIPLGLFFTIFFFYLRTHCGTFNINDSGETIMVCDLLTISHSPGYPLHALWGRVNCLLPLGKPMLRVTFASVITGTLSVVVTYGILKMMFKEIFCPVEQGDGVINGNKPGPWIWEIPSLFGAFIFAFSYQQWFQACGAKGGIYTLSTFLSVSVIFLLFKMRQNGWFIKSFLIMSFVFGLSLANHYHDQLVLFPGYLILFLAAQRRVPISKIITSILRLRLFDFTENAVSILSALGTVNLIRAVCFTFLPVSVYIYLPLRAIQNPIVNWWNPNNFDRLWGTFLRKGYENIGDVTHPLDSFIRNVKRFFFHAQDQFGAIFTYLVAILLIMGVIWLFKRQRTSMASFLAMGLCILLAVWKYCKPLEGYQWTLDNFFTTVFLMESILASAGFAAIFEWVTREWPYRLTPLFLSALCLGFALVPLELNYPLNDQSRYISSYDEGVNMLKSVNRSGVILCNGDIDILPLWYLQFVEHKRTEVASFTMQLIPYDWYRDPLFQRWPFLKVALRRDIYQHDDIRPETVVQDIIDQHAEDRSFYFTNIYTAPWMREKNPSVPEGFLWRIVKTKDLNYAFSTDRLNKTWSTYRLRNMTAPDRGYWDEYTDVMKDSYGIGYDFTGYFSLMNKMPDLALWCFNNALNYRQPQTLSRIYLMLGETYYNINNWQAAINSYQDSIKKDPRNPYAFARMGDCYRMIGDYNDSEQAYRASLAMNPQQKEAQDGLQLLSQTATFGEPGRKP